MQFTTQCIQTPYMCLVYYNYPKHFSHSFCIQPCTEETSLLYLWGTSLSSLRLSCTLYLHLLNYWHTLIYDSLDGHFPFRTSSTPGEILNLFQFPAASRKAIDDVSWHSMSRIFNFLTKVYSFTIVTLITLTLTASREAKSHLRHPFSSMLKYRRDREA